MNIDEKDLIVLDDNHHYLVVKKTDYENKIYYYLSDIDDKGNIKFLYEEGNELVEIDDNNLLDNVIEKMFNDVDLDDFLRELKEKLDEKNNNTVN